tara:strand:+ start:2138 stop:2362 length:225 start_codon:yes stop_codon:yes gene_type:complete
VSNSNLIKKVNWWDEQLDTYYKKMGSCKKIWKDNEGLPYGIYTYDNEEHGYTECFWFKTEQERDDVFNQWEGDF